MKTRLALASLVIAVSAAATIAQTTASQPATATRPGGAAASNPYTRPASRPGATVAANPRDQQPMTNDRVQNLKADLPTLFIAGDSTGATGNASTRGWAAVLVDYFDTSKVNLCNRAIGGTRFNTYMPQYWPEVLGAVKPGDYVVIQLGHNSGPLAGIGEETGPAPATGGRGAAGGTPAEVHTHGWYLRKFIADVREKKATPIAMTLTLRDLWKDGKVERLKELTVGSGTGMSEWTRQVAKNEKVLLIDHSNIIGDIYDKLGEDKVDTMFGDHYLHTNTAGAIVNCEAFISGLKAVPDMPLVQYLNEKGKAIPAYTPAK
jgi:hypothetical protein